MALRRTTMALRRILLLLCLTATIAKTSAQTENTNDRESGAYAFLLYPQIFDGVLVEGVEVPIQFRALIYLNMASFNAWCNYHPTAVDIFGRSRFKRPEREHRRKNKNIAAIYAVLRIYESDPNSFGGPSGLPGFRKLVEDEGLDPDDKSEDLTTAVGIGNREGFDTARLMQVDNWNAMGLKTSSSPTYALPFADTTGYEPRNNPWTIRFPFRWQPVLETDRLGFFFRQEHVTPQAGQTIAFSMTPDEVGSRRAKSPYRKRNRSVDRANRKDLRDLRKYARGVLRKSKELTERQRLLAELFDNKVSAFRTKENPFGVASIAAAVRFFVIGPALDLNLDEEIAFGLAANFASYDSMLVAWKEKVRHDAIRPTGQTMSFAFGDRRFKVWGGPDRGTTRIEAKDWQPYIRTMPHSEFPSASACVCEAVTEQTLAFTNGRDVFPYNVSIPAGSSRFYPGRVPKEDVTIPINRISEWGRLCGESRLYAGVHFEPSVPGGRRLCKGIGKGAQQIVDDMVRGVPNLKWVEWLAPGVERFWEEP